MQPSTNTHIEAQDRPINLKEGIEVADQEMIFQLEAASKLNHFKWKHHSKINGDKKTEPIQVYTRNNTVTNMVVVCGKTTIAEATPQQIIDIVSNPANWKAWDSLTQSVKITELDERHSVACLRFAGVWPVWPRELVHLSTKIVLPDGTMMLGSRSMDHIDYPCDTSSVVRTELYGGGWHVKPVPGTNNVEITYLMNVDVKMPLPNWLVGWATYRFPSIILKVEKDLADMKAGKPPMKWVPEEETDKKKKKKEKKDKKNSRSNSNSNSSPAMTNANANTIQAATVPPLQ